MRRFLLTALALSFAAGAFAQKSPGLADTPQMGWNSWHFFNSNINERIVMETADAMVESGLRDAGYIYVCIDDCWSQGRDSLGFLVCDSTRYPHGIKYMADYVHSKGMKFGIYNAANFKTCAGFEGSYGHEYQDAITYADWGVDYLKYDWCGAVRNPMGAYRLMGDAIASTGRPIFYSIADGGEHEPWLWAKDIGHSWRTYTDLLVAEGFDGGTGSVLDCLDHQEGLRKYAGPGHWNDPDMLTVGIKMSENEDRAHFTMWCMLAAPLMLGNDVRNMSKSTKEILMNSDAIAIDQDSLGIQGMKVRSENGLEYWFKPLKGGDWAFTILNRSTETKKTIVDWNTLVFSDPISRMSTEFDRKVYEYTDIWTKKKGNTKKALKLAIPGHDVFAVRLSLKK